MIAGENHRWRVRLFYFFGKNEFWNPIYILTKLELKFEKCSQLNFKKLNKVLIKK